MTLYTLAERFIGLEEISGKANNGFIQWAHSLCGLDHETPDEVPWCSSWLNALAWICGLPRSRSAAARSWLKVGQPVTPQEARRGDVVVFKRGPSPQPGPEVTSGAPGHVAILDRFDDKFVWVVGGNQDNKVSRARYLTESVLGVRRVE